MGQKGNCSLGKGVFCVGKHCGYTKLLYSAHSGLTFSALLRIKLYAVQKKVS